MATPLRDNLKLQVSYHIHLNCQVSGLVFGDASKETAAGRRSRALAHNRARAGMAVGREPGAQAPLGRWSASSSETSGLSFIEYHALARLSEEPDHRLRMSELAVLTNASLVPPFSPRQAAGGVGFRAPRTGPERTGGTRSQSSPRTATRSSWPARRRMCTACVSSSSMSSAPLSSSSSKVSATGSSPGSTRQTGNRS